MPTVWDQFVESEPAPAMDPVAKPSPWDQFIEPEPAVRPADVLPQARRQVGTAARDSFDRYQSDPTEKLNAHRHGWSREVGATKRLAADDEQAAEIATAKRLAAQRVAEFEARQDPNAWKRAILANDQAMAATPEHQADREAQAIYEAGVAEWDRYLVALARSRDEDRTPPEGAIDPNSVRLDQVRDQVRRERGLPGVLPERGLASAAGGAFRAGGARLIEALTQYAPGGPHPELGDYADEVDAEALDYAPPDLPEKIAGGVGGSAPLVLGTLLAARGGRAGVGRVAPTLPYTLPVLTNRIAQAGAASGGSALVDSIEDRSSEREAVERLTESGIEGLGTFLGGAAGVEAAGAARGGARQFLRGVLEEAAEEGGTSAAQAAAAQGLFGRDRDVLEEAIIGAGAGSTFATAIQAPAAARGALNALLDETPAATPAKERRAAPTPDAPADDRAPEAPQEGVEPIAPQRAPERQESPPPAPPDDDAIDAELAMDGARRQARHSDGYARAALDEEGRAAVERGEDAELRAPVRAAAGKKLRRDLERGTTSEAMRGRLAALEQGLGRVETVTHRDPTAKHAPASDAETFGGEAPVGRGYHQKRIGMAPWAEGFVRKHGRGRLDSLRRAIRKASDGKRVTRGTWGQRYLLDHGLDALENPTGNPREAGPAHELAEDVGLGFGDDRARSPIQPYSPDGPAERRKVSEAEAPVQERFATYLETRGDEARQRYRANPKTRGGKIISADEVKALSEDFARDGSLANAVHGPSSWFADRLYEEALRSGEAGPVVMLAGGAGSGKSTSLEAAGLADRAGVVVDGIFANIDSARRRIEMARHAGRPVQVAYVHTPIDVAVPRMVDRAHREKRAVPLGDAADKHYSAQDTFLRLAEEYKSVPGLTFVAIDNSGTPEQIAPKSVEWLRDKKYARGDEVRQRAADAYQAHRNRLDPAYDRAFASDLPEAGGPDAGPARVREPGVGEPARRSGEPEEDGAVDGQVDRVEARRGPVPEVPGQQRIDFGPAVSEERAVARGDTAPSQDADLMRLLTKVRGAVTMKPGQRVSSLVKGYVEDAIPAFDLRGQKVTGHDDAAVLFAALRSPYVERVSFIVAAEDGTIIDSGIYSIGTMTGAAAPIELEQFTNLVRERTTAHGRIRVYLAHNHPSGNPEPSNADRVVYQRAFSGLRHHGADFVGIVTDGDRYSVMVDRDGAMGVESHAFSKRQDKPFETVPLERKRNSVRTPDKAAGFVRRIQTDPTAIVAIGLDPHANVQVVRVYEASTGSAAIVTDLIDESVHSILLTTRDEGTYRALTRDKYGQHRKVSDVVLVRDGEAPRSAWLSADMFPGLGSDRVKHSPIPERLSKARTEESDREEDNLTPRFRRSRNEYEGRKVGEAGTTYEAPGPKAFRLPDDLKRIAPRYGFRDRNFTLTFASDFDRATYALAKTTTRSKAHGRILAALEEQTGLAEAELVAHGQRVRASLKEQAKTAPEWEDEIEVAKVSFRRPASSGAPPTDPPAAPPASPAEEPEGSAKPPSKPKAPAGQAPRGRPDLANPGATEPVRDLVDSVDETRNETGQPKLRPDEEVIGKALERLAADYQGEKARLLEVARVGQLSDVDTVVAQQIINDRGLAALRSGDPTTMLEAAMLVNAYRAAGAEQARAFRQRRDQFKDPAQRAAGLITEAVLTPPAATRKKIDDARAEGDLETVRRELEKWVKKANKLRLRLKKLGVDLDRLRKEDLKDRTKAAAAVRAISAAKADNWDALHEYWINSLLSAPTTQAANIFGNLGNGFLDLAVERPLEALVGTVIGGKDSAKLGELRHLYRGLLPGIIRGSRNALLAWKTEMQVLDDEVAGELSFVRDKLDRRGPSIQGKAGRFVRSGFTGLGGTRMLGAMDQFFKSMFAEMEAGAHAYRIAKGEGKNGAALGKRVAELVTDIQSDAWQKAIDRARDLAFQKDLGDAGKMLLLAREKVPGLRYVVPFVTAPVNILKTGLRKSPLGLINMAARIAGQGAVSMKWADGSWSYSRGKFAKHLVEQALAWAAVYAIASLMGEDDEGLPRITGSSDWKDPGKGGLQARSAPAMSVRIGDEWVSYGRVEPFATTLALVVDMLGAKKEIAAGKDFSSLAGEAFTALVGQVQDKTFLRGIADLLDAVQDPNQAAKWGMNFATSWVPNVIRAGDRALEEKQEERKIWGDSAVWWTRAGTRILEDLPGGPKGTPKVDLWGREVAATQTAHPATDWLYRMFSPVKLQKVQRDSASELDRLLINWNNAHPNDGFFPRLPMPSYTVTSEDGQRERRFMTDKQYHDFLVASGKQAAQDLAEAELDADNPTIESIKLIEKVLRQSRAAAREELIGETAEE